MWMLSVLFVLFDAWYFIRFFVSCFIFTLGKTKSLLDESVIYGICLTTDLDFMVHMNNARYLRECDFGRFKIWIQNGVWHKLRSVGGDMTNVANNIRYRRSLQLFNIYQIRSKVIYWDDKAFYVEQQVIRTKDRFVCAVNIVKQTLIGVSPDVLVQKLPGEPVRKPEMTEELDCLFKSWQLSSERLRKNT